MRIRTLAIVAICLATSLICKAQIGAYRNNFSIGFNGGYVLSNVGFSPRVDQGYHSGITGGLSFRYVSEKYFNTICSIYAEVNYAALGWKQDIKDLKGNAVVNSSTGLAEE